MRLTGFLAKKTLLLTLLLNGIVNDSVKYHAIVNCVTTMRRVILYYNE